MDKTKILLVGTNTSVIDDFFFQLSDTFECLTSSLRYDDIVNHIKYFSPEVLVYCMHEETRDAITRVISARAKTKLSLAVYGTPEDIAALEANPGGRIDVKMGKPMNSVAVRIAITNFVQRKAEAEAIKATQEKSQADSLKKHVLVIDDDPMMLKLIKEYLHEDYNIGTAINGRTAFKFLETRSTDMILLDYEMPGEKGPEVLKKIRENPKTAAVPVVFLTGITEKEKIQDALAQKPQGYLLKPIDHDKLMATITKFI